ncbi:YggS family pyridoxal phosphate-dependent enzyme [Parablautia muri]|uniref:YggS family pyridoxal phosphate-dependent enzyme n=1 Tax=Parablautia muri TaxID=2320879 RepID=UPI001371414B|nr:YggS family pyridoxal phosphate-dependent enzyme [Parablautia muri]
MKNAEISNIGKKQDFISQNLDFVNQNITKACEKAGRGAEDVTLIAVSKTKPVSMLKEAYKHGCRAFGENKVQELVEKYEEMPKDIQWHMIGHLQRNKVKYVVGKAALIHSVDTLKLAEEISREAVKKQTEVSILIEVNIAGEESKYGVAMAETEKLVREAALLPGIHIKGLMTIAPYVEEPEENRQYFALLRQLSVDIKQKNIDNVNMNVLSMGMTGDYMVAIEEGATYVRVGTGIFGERQYPAQRE